MRRRENPPTGLEAAPDIMLLTMAGLMVSVVWLTSHAEERTLPPVQLPKSEAAGFGRLQRAPLQVTLRPVPATQTPAPGTPSRASAARMQREAAATADRERTDAAGRESAQTGSTRKSARIEAAPDSARKESAQIEVWIDDRRLAGGLPALEAALRASGVGAMTLRADAGTRWDHVLDAMSVAAELDWEVTVAADR